MVNWQEKEYLVVVQCHIVKERCPGYLCEKALHEHTGAYADLPEGKPLRRINLTCGGCCGRALHRKLTNLARTIKKKEGIEKGQILIQFSTCMTKDNYHAPPCPHLAYLTTLVERAGLALLTDTVICETSEKRRQEGLYPS
jgi:predicted metal-binding protein